MLFRRAALALFALCLGSAALAAQTPTGKLTGRVLDSIQGLPMPGVSVAVVGTPTVAVTDVDGRYRLDLPLGKHQIKVTLAGFEERLLDVELTSPTIKDIDVTLALSGYSETITVAGTSVDAETSSLAAQLSERRRANTILDNLGSAEMKANADSSAAAALSRVTGLSVVNHQSVFVRGLGERYSNTTLNGATLPSTEPERKVVSLDMFPSGLLDSVSIVKSYTPDRSAEFAGGLVEISPSRMTSRPMANVAYSFGGNSQSWGQSILDHSAGSRDWLGLSNSSRGLPAGIPDRRVIRGGIFTPEIGVLPADLERFGEAFVNEWTPSIADGKPHQGFSASLGNRWGKFGISAGVNQSYKQEYVEETQVYYSQGETGLTPFSTYDYNVGSTTGTFAGIVNAGYAINANNRVSFQGFSTDKGRRETRTFEGFNDDIARNIRNSRLLWTEENLRSAQFSGDHFFQGLANSRLDWRGSYARSNRDEPDARETLYQEISGVYRLADESQSGLRMFNDLDETSLDVAASWSTAFAGPRALPAMLKFGTSFTNRDRDFSHRRFRFIPINIVRFDLSGAPESIFTPENIGPRFELREETRSTDFYQAEQRVGAGFGMLDLSLTSRSRLIAGVRVEHFRQTVDTFDLFDADLDEEVQTIRGEIEETDLFPSVNFVQDLGGNRNLRFGVSQTVNRPEFRELAPFEFTDIVGGRAVVGNPDLERSLIRNVDARFEWFPSSLEVIAASVFFKHFDQPIERFVEPTAQLRTSFTNAKSARNFGVELEARKRVSSAFSVGGNYTFVDSSITLQDFQTNVLTSLERPLSGTSRHVANAMVEGYVAPVTARVLVNYFGDRIVDVGSLGLPDILEEGRTTVDLVVSSRLGQRFSVRFSAENLGNRPVRFLQGPETHREFTLGRTFAVQFGVIGF
jgi:hypothetical protein